MSTNPVFVCTDRGELKCFFNKNSFNIFNIPSISNFTVGTESCYNLMQSRLRIVLKQENKTQYEAYLIWRNSTLVKRGLLVDSDLFSPLLSHLCHLFFYLDGFVQSYNIFHQQVKDSIDLGLLIANVICKGSRGKNVELILHLFSAVFGRLYLKC